MIAILKSLTRILAVVRKELIDIRRRPGAVLSLILGPFLIMAIFGAGYQGIRRPLDTVLVIPPESGLSQNAADYQELAGGADTARLRGDLEQVASQVRDFSRGLASTTALDNVESAFEAPRLVLYGILAWMAVQAAAAVVAGAALIRRPALPQPGPTVPL